MTTNLKKNIVLVLNSESSDGGKFTLSHSFLEALNKLCKEKYEPAIVYTNKEWDKILFQYGFNLFFFKRKMINKISRKMFLCMPFGLYLWRNISVYLDPLQKILFKLKPNLVFYPNTDSFCYESKLPSMTIIHDLMHRYEPNFPEVNDRRTYSSRETHYKKIGKYVSLILVDSDIGKKQAIESYNIEPDKIKPLPFCAPPYTRKDLEFIDVRKKYNLPGRYIFYSAQLWKHKNHEGIINALYILKEKGVIVNAVFTGSDKNNWEQLSSNIKRLGLEKQIFYLGFVSVDELISLYKTAVAFVMPTFFGPTNVPPLEAFAYGCPVITSNIYAIPTQLGDAALYVDPKSPEDIAEKIQLVWEKQGIRQSLIIKGYEKNKNWNIETFSKKLNSIIDDLVLKNDTQ